MLDLFLDVLLDTVLDAVKLTPFLFLTYLVMEYIEHKTSEKAANIVGKAGRFGPVIGGILGVVPQCGFSAAASNLYAGRIISVGTLIAIYLSTSDEMLPIFISEQVDAAVIFKILGLKLLIGMIAGLIIDFVRSKLHKPFMHPRYEIDHLCEHEHCHCEEGNVLMSAVRHTLHILLFIFLITFVLNGVIAIVGEDALAGLIQNKPILGPMIAGVVGLIPNCAASVVITQLFLEGVLGTGAMLAGLLVGAGVGLLILFRVNNHWKENCKIVVLLYVIGVAAGILIELSGIVI